MMAQVATTPTCKKKQQKAASERGAPWHNAKGYGEYDLMALRKELQISQPLACTSDAKDSLQHQVPGLDAHSALHTGMRHHHEIADKIELFGSRNALGL